MTAILYCPSHISLHSNATEKLSDIIKLNLRGKASVSVVCGRVFQASYVENLVKRSVKEWICEYSDSRTFCISLVYLSCVFLCV